MNVNEIPWDKEPTATHFTFDDEDWYEAFWKKIDGSWWCKYRQPESWQIVDWTDTVYQMEDFNVLIERPKAADSSATSSDESWCSDDWYVDGKAVKLPPVGVVCEAWYCGEWRECEIIAHFEQAAGQVAAFTIEQGCSVKSLDAFCKTEFRPLIKEPSIQEKLLEKWRMRGIDFAYDTEKSSYWLKHVFEWLDKNYELKEKE